MLFCALPYGQVWMNRRRSLVSRNQARKKVYMYVFNPNLCHWQSPPLNRWTGCRRSALFNTVAVGPLCESDDVTQLQQQHKCYNVIVVGTALKKCNTENNIYGMGQQATAQSNRNSKATKCDGDQVLYVCGCMTASDMNGGSWTKESLLSEGELRYQVFTWC